jgi:signal transduction histidine kinase
LLNVAKADAGRMVMKTSVIDLRGLVESVVAEQRLALGERPLDLKTKLPKEPVLIHGDEEKLFMAVSNIVDNACKYTPDGGHVVVSVQLKDKRQAKIEVADSGVGIDQKDIKHIFDRFQRANDVLQGHVGGTGLGLYLARKIMELHNGSIEATSKKSHGTQFIMTIPVRKPDVAKNSPR